MIFYFISRIQKYKMKQKCLLFKCLSFVYSKHDEKALRSVKKSWKSETDLGKMRTP